MITDLDEISAKTRWTVVPLREVVTLVQYGMSVRGEPVGDLPMLRMNCQRRGRVTFDDLQYIGSSTHASNAFLLQDGDLLFNRTNSLEHVGRTAIFRGTRPAVFASYLVRVRVDKMRIDSDFLNYFLNWSPTQRTLKGFASRGVSQANISASRLKDLDILVPPLGEQHAIVRLLTAIDNVLETEERRLRELNELWHATLRRLFSSGLSGETARDEHVGEKPLGWSSKRLSELASFVSGGTPPKHDVTLWQGNVPWVSPKDMKGRIITDIADSISETAAQSYSRVVPANSLLVVIRGMILAREIPVCLVEKQVAFNQDVKALIPRTNVDPHFLLYALLARRRALGAAIGTSAHGTRRIGTAALEELFIPVAPHEDQRQVGALMRGIDDRITSARRAVDLLTELAESVRTAVLTGSLSVEALLEERP